MRQLARLGLVSLIVLIITTAGCGTGIPPMKRLSIATGSTGGVYYPYGVGLAELITKYVKNVRATAEATPASVDNIKLIAKGNADLAFTLADIAYDASQGRDKFQEIGKIGLRTLAVLYPNYMHLVTVEGTGINSVADLKGKRVSVGAAGSGTEIKATRVLEAFGLDPARDFTRERLGVTESAEAIKNRKIDAFFWDGGLPTTAIRDLGITPGMTLKLIPTADAIQKMVDKYGPFYFRVTIPKGTYSGVDVDVPVVGVANLLVVSDRFDEGLAYEIVKAMFEHKAELESAHLEVKKLSLESSVVGSPIPYHPGAIKYYKEKKVWPEK